MAPYLEGFTGSEVVASRGILYPHIIDLPLILHDHSATDLYSNEFSVKICLLGK